MDNVETRVEAYGKLGDAPGGSGAPPWRCWTVVDHACLLCFPFGGVLGNGRYAPVAHVTHGTVKLRFRRLCRPPHRDLTYSIDFIMQHSNIIRTSLVVALTPAILASKYRTKVEKSLAEAPVSLPAVILLNFRDKLEEDAVAKASGKSRTPQPPPAPTPPPPPETKTSTDPPTLLKDSGDGNVAAGDGSAIAKEGVAVEAGEGGVVKEDEGGGGVGVDAWAHVATLETARAMMDRVRELDIAEGRGSGRRVSLFDCSMKNCFGLRVRRRKEGSDGDGCGVFVSRF